MKDPDFLQSMKEGTTNITFGTDLELTVDMEVSEEGTEGIWVPKERRIMKVHSVSKRGQMSLNLPY
jgi:hypothetical protein